MSPNVPITAVAHVIQLAVAPVFLLTGISAMLGVLVNRLGRVVDRARLLEGQLAASPEGERQRRHDELGMLSRRARLVNWSISLCTTAALLVCVVIALLFVGAFAGTDVTAYVAALFVAAMLVLIGGLMSFLREVYLGTANLRIGPH